MSYTPKAGETVYSNNGAMAVYVSQAQGGGHIVQPLIEEGDGVTEPESYYADGVAIWPSVYREAPRQKLEAEIAAQAEKLATLRREVAEAERQRMQATIDQRAVRERLAQHEALLYLDDFLNAKITHYVLELDGQVQVLDSEAFNKQRGLGYSERVLTLIARVSDGKTALRWFIKTPDGVGGREIASYPDEQAARAQAHALVTEKMKEALRQLRQGYSYGLDAAMSNAKALGMPVLPELLDLVREPRIKAAQKAAEMARETLATAEKQLQALGASEPATT